MGMEIAGLITLYKGAKDFIKDFNKLYGISEVKCGILKMEAKLNSMYSDLEADTIQNLDEGMIKDLQTLKENVEVEAKKLLLRYTTNMCIDELKSLKDKIEENKKNKYKDLLERNTSNFGKVLNGCTTFIESLIKELRYKWKVFDKTPEEVQIILKDIDYILERIKVCGKDLEDLKDFFVEKIDYNSLPNVTSIFDSCGQFSILLSIYKRLEELFLMLFRKYSDLSNRSCEVDTLRPYKDIFENYIFSIFSILEINDVDFRSEKENAIERTIEYVKENLPQMVDDNNLRKYCESIISSSLELFIKIIRGDRLSVIKALKAKLPEAEEILEKLKAKCAKCEK